jgi:hypothetical protein
MIRYQKAPFVSVAEFYFDEDTSPTGADIVYHFWRSCPVAGSHSKESHSLVLDLSDDTQALLSSMHAETRYRIRRAEKDNFQYQCWPDVEPDVFSRFCEFFDEFAKAKHLVPANRKRLGALAQLGLLDMSCIRDSTGMELVWHVHYRAADRARGMYSASLLGRTTDPSLRALIGRANCYHTWRDISRFQEQGLAKYDLGGWYDGTEDQEKLRINTFKAGFGGTIVTEFNSEKLATTKGTLALAVKSLVLHSRVWAHGR